MTVPPQPVLFISHDSERTGAPLELLLIVRHLDTNRFRPVVILGKDGPLRLEFEKVAETVVAPLFPAGPKYLRELPVFMRRMSLLRSRAPAVVYCNTVMCTKWLLYARMLGMPTVMHVHELGSVLAMLSVPDRFILRTCAGRCIAASHAVKDCLVSDYSLDPGRITVIPEAIDTRSWVYGERMEGHPVVIGLVGRIARMKGTDYFIAMAEKILRDPGNRDHLAFRIIGGTAPGEEDFARQLHRLVDDAGIGKWLTFGDAVPDVPAVMRGLDVVVVPSREDPFPLVVLEAMASGKPVVAFKTGGIGEEIDASCGMLVEPGNIDALAAAVETLSANPGLRASFGDAGRRRVETNFDIRNVVAGIEDILCQAEGGGIRHPG